MPKNWAHHEAEIRRLYMKEGRALKEVRRIMSDQYKFDASIRAYRMKFDEWELRKNKSSKERRVRKTLSLAALGNPDEPVGKQYPPSDVSDETGSQLEAIHPGSVAPPAAPAAPNVQEGPTATIVQPPEIPLEEVLAIADRGHAFNKLETMFLKLRPGVGGVKTVLPWLEEHCPAAVGDVAMLFLLVSTSAVFEMGPADEISLLIKACLEADLKAQQQRISTGNEYILDWIWLADWSKACLSSDWDVAKRHLFRIQSPFGEKFNGILVDCALIVTAERLLRYLMEWLEARRARVEPLSSHESEEARQFRDAYITILDDFREKELDVDISWYRYALQVAAWNEAVATVMQDDQKQRLEQLESDSQKYRQLQSMFKAMEGVSNGGDVVACNVPAVEPTHHVINHTEDFSHTQAMGVLLAKWRSGDAFESSVLSLLSKDGEFENLFNLLDKVVPQSDQIPFAKALLRVLDVHSRRNKPTSVWWRAVHP